MLGYFGDNIMAEVARALGVELGEPFVVENSTDKYIDQGHKGDWCSADYILPELITGKRVRIRRKIEQGTLFDVGT